MLRWVFRIFFWHFTSFLDLLLNKVVWVKIYVTHAVDRINKTWLGNLSCIKIRSCEDRYDQPNSLTNQSSTGYKSGHTTRIPQDHLKVTQDHDYLTYNCYFNACLMQN